MPIEKCDVLPDIPTIQELMLMAGIKVSTLYPDLAQYRGQAYDAVMSALAQAQPALAASKPIMDQVEFGVAVAACVTKAVEVIQSTVNRITDPLAPPPDVQGLLACVPELEQKLAAILNLLPQVWAPILIAQVVQAVARLVNAVLVELQRIKSQIASLLAIANMAGTMNNGALQAIVVCRQESVQKDMNVLAEAFRQVGVMFATVNVLLRLLKQLGVIPEDTEYLCFPTSNFAVDAIDALIDILAGFLDFLQDFQNFITKFIQQLGLDIGAGNGLEIFCPPEPA